MRKTASGKTFSSPMFAMFGVVVIIVIGVCVYFHGKQKHVSEQIIHVTANSPVTLGLGDGENLMVFKDENGKVNFIYHGKDLELSYDARTSILAATVVNQDGTKVNLVDTNKDFLFDTRAYSNKKLETSRVEKLDFLVIESKEIGPKK